MASRGGRGGNNSGLSRKELEVLERQRRLADSLKRASTATAAIKRPTLRNKRGGVTQTNNPQQQAASTTATTNTGAKPQNATTATATATNTNKNNKMTKKQGNISTSAILEAARLRAIAKKNGGSSSSNAIDTSKEDSNKEGASVASTASKPTATTTATATATATTATKSGLIRPKLKGKNAQLASAVAAAAADKANTSASGKDDNNSVDDEDKKDNVVDSMKLKRKPPQPSGTSSMIGNSLASLVQKSAKTVADAIVDDDYEGPSLINSTMGLPTMEPDHFWKHLRDWNILGEISTYNEQAATTNNNNKDEKKDNSTNDSSKEDNLAGNVMMKKPLPNIFLNAKHYVAAWAPLLLAETRSQWISEILSGNSNDVTWSFVQTSISSANNANKRGKGNDMTNYWDDDSYNNDCQYIKIVPDKSVNQNNNVNFTTFDLALLVPVQYKEYIIKLFQGKSNVSPPYNANNDWKKCAVVGHALYSKRELFGLVLQVSKKRWAAIGTDTMWLVKLGGNVTALREFTALCRVDHLPMKRYLLGLHLENNNKNKNKNKASSEKKEQLLLTQNEEVENQQQDPLSSSSLSSKKDLLETMGGSQALGKGFTAYVQKKFNPSQLTAIAASAHEYGEGGFTLIKGPPGTGKTTTLVAVLNSLHIRQYNKYYEEVRRIAGRPIVGKNSQYALDLAKKSKPRLLVCAPSNAAVDNVILKIFEDGFVDGSGQRYNPSMIRIGVGKSPAVRAVALEDKVDAIIGEHLDVSELDTTIERHRIELHRVTNEMSTLRAKAHAIANASPWPLSKDWEIRVDDDSFETTQRVYFVNHKEKTTSYEVPPPPEPGQVHFQPTAMPEYRSYMSRIVKLVESAFAIKKELERCTIIKNAMDNGLNNASMRQALETHVLNSVHLTMTTLGTSGGRVLEAAEKFEVVVIDEAAQSVEPSILSALSLGSRHCILVGDPQQLPATIFNVSGRNTKYDRSLFQRLEEAGQPIYMLDQQYRMHPKISHFPRHIFYGGNLLDGPNVVKPNYGDPFKQLLLKQIPHFQPFTVLDLESTEQRGGTSLSNAAEAQLAVYLYMRLNEVCNGMLLKVAGRVAVITPYAQQTNLLTRYFVDLFGKSSYTNYVEINTVDAFQGREANIVIFSAVRASDVKQGKGIGFLSDVRRMNVALTRAKHFLFVIARCESIIVNPYWRELVRHARESNAVLRVPIFGGKGGRNGRSYQFGNAEEWEFEHETDEQGQYGRSGNNTNFYPNNGSAGNNVNSGEAYNYSGNAGVGGSVGVGAAYAGQEYSFYGSAGNTIAPGNDGPSYYGAGDAGAAGSPSQDFGNHGNNANVSAGMSAGQAYGYYGSGGAVMAPPETAPSLPPSMLSQHHLLPPQSMMGGIPPPPPPPPPPPRGGRGYQPQATTKKRAPPPDPRNRNRRKYNIT